MDQTQQNPIETPAGIPSEEKSMGALIGSIIVVAVIVIGGIYFWLTRESRSPVPTETPSLEQTMPADQETALLLNQGASNEISDIEKDLNATNFDNLDAGMGDIDAQL